MPKSIDNLLKKKGWTGKEVGQLLIASMLNDIKEQGNPDKKPLFSQQDFERMESSLTSDSDYTIYGVYRDLYSSIIDSFNRGQSLYQQFYNGFSRLLIELRELENADHAQASIDDTPLIMTESQYTRLEAEAATTLKGYKDSYYSLMFYILDRFLKADEEAPDTIPPAIKDALEAAKGIPATAKGFSRSYNELMGEGYYTLPDGRRSDQMTSEEWQKVLEEEYLKSHSLTIDGRPATAEETIGHFNRERLIKSYGLFFNGAKAIRDLVMERTGEALDATDEEIEEALNATIDYVGKQKGNLTAEQIAEALDFSTPTEWHISSDLPEGLTAYDLLEIIADSSHYADTDEKEHLKKFREEYTDLYNALTAYIEEKVPQARGLNPNQLHKDIASWGELAEAGVIGYERLIQPTDSKIVEIWTGEEDTTENESKRLRAGLRRIAIIKHPASYQVDENGDYIEKRSPLSFFQSLYTLEEDGNKIAEIHAYIDNLINPALSYLYAFNALMSILGEVYDLPELAQVATLDTDLFESKIGGFNGMLYLFYHDVYGSETEKQRKRAIIKEVFTPLETDSLKPTQEAIDAIKEELTKLGLSSSARKQLKYLDAFIDRLMNSGEGAL